MKEKDSLTKAQKIIDFPSDCLIDDRKEKRIWWYIYSINLLL